MILMFFNFTANDNLLFLVKHLLGDLHRIGSCWPATVEGDVGDDFTDLFWGDAVIESAADVPPQLLGAIECRQDAEP